MVQHEELKLKKGLYFGQTFWKVRFKGGSDLRVQFASNCFKLVSMFLDRGHLSKMPLGPHTKARIV